MKDKLVTAVKAAISLGLMTYLLYRFLSDPLDRAVLTESLTGANYWYLMLALVLFMLALVVSAVKWQVLLKAQGIPVPLKPLVKYTYIGAFFNNFLPANIGGDVIRGVGLARYIDRNADAAVSVIVDRIIGLLGYMFSAVVAALIAVYVISSGQLGTEAVDEVLLQNLAKVETIAIIGLLIILAAFAVMLSDRLRDLLGRVFTLKPLKSLAPLYQQISDAFGAYRYEYRALLMAFLLGVVNIILTSLVDIAILTGLHVDISPIYVFLFNPIIAVILIAPISIGGLGTMSVLYVYFYGLVGVPPATAFAVSLIKQAIIYIGSFPGGFLWLQGRKTNVTLNEEPENLADVTVRQT